MEPKRELASVDIAAVVREFDHITGAFFDKAYVYPEDDLYRLKLRHPDRGRLELLAQVGELKRIHLADPATIPDAPARPPNFAKMLRNQLANGTVSRVRQVGFDRIVAVTFDTAQGNVELILELFGDGNVVVIGNDGTIVDCREEVRLRSRTIRPGGTYEPPAQEVNTLTLSRASFEEVMLESTSDVVRTLATSMNLGGRYAEELCTRAEVEKALAIDDLYDAAIDDLYDELSSLVERLERGSFEPRVYADDTGVVDVSPFPLAELDHLDAEAHPTVSAAIDAYFRALGDRTDLEARKADDDERAKLQRIREQQRGAIESLKADATALREQAELLYANYTEVENLLGVIRNAREDGHDWAEIERRLREAADRGVAEAELLAGARPERHAVILALDDQEVLVEVDHDIEHNADRLYREAKEVEDKRQGAIEALEETEAAIDELEQGDVGVEPVDADVAWVDRSSIPIRQPDHWFERFRWFHTTDGFLVIGGRDARQNEELIDRYAEPGDLVLHSQAHGGPVTFIKATAPDEPRADIDFPETTVEQAAQFAVSYSSVWKDGHYTGDVYAVEPDQMTKEAESGEYLGTGAFAVRGEREYHRDVPVGIAIGMMCEPETRIIGGPPAAIVERSVVHVDLEPGRFAPSDVAKRIYRQFQETFADRRFVRSVAGVEEIQAFLPPGGSRIVDDG